MADNNIPRLDNNGQHGRGGGGGGRQNRGRGGGQGPNNRGRGGQGGHEGRGGGRGNNYRGNNNNRPGARGGAQDNNYGQGEQNQRGNRGNRGRGNQNARGNVNRNNQIQEPSSARRRDFQVQKRDSVAPAVLALNIEILKDLLTRLPDDVILTLANTHHEHWAEVFVAVKVDDSTLLLIIHLLGEKVCIDFDSSEMEVDPKVESAQVALLMKTHMTQFSKNLHIICQKMYWHAKEPNVERAEKTLIDQSNGFRILRNLYTFYSFLNTRIPYASVDFLKKLLPETLKLLAAIVVPKEQHEELNHLKNNFTELSEIINPAAVAPIPVEKHMTAHSVRDETKSKSDKAPGLSEATAANATDKPRRNHFAFTAEEEERLHKMDPPENFREIAIFPTIDELLNPEESFLRPNRKSGAYRDADHYLDVQFRLFREDFLRPLKTGVQEFMNNRHDYLSGRKRMPWGTVRMYQNIRVISVDLVRDATIFSLQLLPEMYKKIKWKTSRRLMNGSLLIITPDLFKTGYFATVSQRSDEVLTEKGIIGISWEGAVPTMEILNQGFLMFESECYFEAYRHTLKVLQEVELEEFPLAKFIIKSSHSVGPPKYLAQADELMKIGNQHISPLNGQWPSAHDLKLDDTQHAAFREALTKEISIIQGPPGCGKTFIGLKITEALIINRGLWWKNEYGGHGHERPHGGPILVVCLTNHALDQFLEGILCQLKKLFPNEDPGLIRVGGRTQSESLSEVSLQRKRQAAAKMYLHSHDFRRRRSAATRRVREAEVEKRDLASESLQLADLKGIIDFPQLVVWNELKDFCSDDLWEYFRHPEAFGLNNDARYTVENRIRQEFRMRQRNAGIRQVPAQAQAVDFEDDEDYDPDDLPRHLRGDYDPDFGAPKHGKNKNEPAPKSLSYFQGLSLKELESKIRDLQGEANRTRRNHDQPPARRTANMEHIEQNIATARFQLEFLEKLFAHFKNNELVLPNMDPVRAARLVDGRQGMTVPETWATYLAVVERARLITAHNSALSEQQLVEAQKDLQTIYREGDGFLLAGTKVVGMTTTGASKNGDLLQMMKSKIVIVEEAAEVLEAHIINCLTKHCEQLIMIGDHQQLRPNIAVYELERKYNLNISLFERMVNNNLSCHRLLVQHRMRPEISDLVRGTIYKQLSDHPSVLEFPTIRGVEKSLYFITHNQLEKADGDSVTKTNIYEVKFLAALCQYLVLQGYKTSQITILVTYTGQMYLLRKELEGQANCKGVRVCAVDNFQGEENEIILLSMVRSNNDNNIGFLKTDNRICVALSRAKHGLFIIGNMTNLVASSGTWGQIKSKLVKRNEFGDCLTLRCSVHGTQTRVRTAGDFSKVPEGGCTLLCGSILACGHKCKAVCHVKNIEQLHRDTKCLQPCTRTCVRGHSCKGKCFSTCQPCGTQVEQLLRCGHSTQVKCHEFNLNARCVQLVKRPLTCGHILEMKCYEDESMFYCTVPVVKKLGCGHEKSEVACHLKPSTLTCEKLVMKKNILCGHPMEIKCHLNPAYVRVTCQVVVTKRFSLCGHQLELKCCENKDTLVCRNACTRRLGCGHACTKFCHVDNDPLHVFSRCEKRCERVCQNDHPCRESHICSEPCQPCSVPVEKKLICKTHSIVVACSTDVSNRQCYSRCERTLPGCDHQCKKLCCDPCSPCQKLVEKKAPCGHFQIIACSRPALKSQCKKLVEALTSGISTCGHTTMVPCGLKETITREESKKYCKKPCNYVFEENDGGCGHKCSGNCSECYEGRLHKKCAEECGRVLVCGHVCNFPCSSVCPPCAKGCDMRCDHSTCGSNCGEPCIDCHERCTWKCKHQVCSKLCKEDCDRGPCEIACSLKIPKCGHPCIGFCGEPCPPQCRICDKAELTEFILYGNEDGPDARFVYLRDCGHSIEAEGMDHYMSIELDEGAISSKSCPRCKTLIRHSKRYGNILRKQIAEVLKVKRLIFGNEKLVTIRQSKLLTEIYGNPVWSNTLPEVHKYVVQLLAIVEKRVKVLFFEVSKEKMVPKKIDARTFSSIEIIAKHAKDAVSAINDAKLTKFNLKDELSKKYAFLFEKLMERSLPLSSTEIKDFDREFERLFDLQQLFIRGSRMEPGNENAGSVFRTALQVINGPSIYTPTVKSSIHHFIKELDARLRTGLGITAREKQDILKAMNMRQGHWYKCPNGHIYVITECGGAMQESVCPETGCGAKIGGGQHRLRQDNHLATEMDGAIAPSYPNNVLRF